jgi:hypothetical protein
MPEIATGENSGENTFIRRNWMLTYRKIERCLTDSPSRILPCCLSITPSPIDAPAQAQAVRDWVSIFTNTKATQQDVCL